MHLRNGVTSRSPNSVQFPAHEAVQERLLNAREVAARLGVSERWVRDHTTRRSPRIRAVKLGTLIRYRRIDVEMFMESVDTFLFPAASFWCMNELFSTAKDRPTALETENSSGYEISEGHRLPKREEGEDVVWEISGLSEGPARKGGLQAPLHLFVV